MIRPSTTITTSRVLKSCFLSPLVSFLPSAHAQLIKETQPYMRARITLCTGQQTVAEQNQTRDAWTVVLDHHLEMLRLCAADNMGARMPTPFLLLRLNRDDDTYCFCRHWLGTERSNNEGHAGNTHEGDWIYPREANSRFRDVTQDVGEPCLGRFCEVSFYWPLQSSKCVL